LQHDAGDVDPPALEIPPGEGEIVGQNSQNASLFSNLIGRSQRRAVGHPIFLAAKWTDARVKSLLNPRRNGLRQERVAPFPAVAARCARGGGDSRSRLSMNSQRLATVIQALRDWT
jgi:hypothetical protein